MLYGLLYILEWELKSLFIALGYRLLVVSK